MDACLSHASISQMSRLAKLVPWVERLTGLETERVRDSIAEVQSWRLPQLEEHLLAQPDLDTLVATALLTEAIADLVDQGVERTKLIKKLRDARSELQF